MMELLPAICHATIAEYLPLETESEDDIHRAPWDGGEIKLAKIKRGFALAVCSRRCHDLMEEAADFLLAGRRKKNHYIFSWLFYVEGTQSDRKLSQFYTLKTLEAQAHQQLRCLEWMTEGTATVAITDDFTIHQRIMVERNLLQQVDRVLEGIMVRSCAVAALGSCIAGCAEALRVRPSYNLRTTTQAEIATPAVAILERAVALLERLSDDEAIEHRVCALLLLLLANGRKETPDWLQVQSDMDRLLAVLNDNPLIKLELPPSQQIFLFCLSFLFHHGLGGDIAGGWQQRLPRRRRPQLSGKAINQAFGLVERYRQCTSNSCHQRRAVQLVMSCKHVFGVERCLAFVRESLAIAEEQSSLAEAPLGHEYLNELEAYLRELGEYSV